MNDTLPYAITPEHVSTYDRDGAILLKGLFSPDWIALLDDGLSRSRAEPTDRGHAWAREEAQREIK